MTKNETFTLCAKLTGYISAENPVYDLSAKDIKTEKKKYTPDELSEYRRKGWLGDDFELFCVVKKFLEDRGVLDTCDGEYIGEIFANARKFGVGEFYADEYIQNVKFDDVQKGKFLLTHAEYARGELLLYDAPDLDAECVVPKIGFFTGKVSFPTLYEGVIPWMSVCPSEINSMKEQMRAAHGNVLVLGCGLGYYQYVVSERENVDSVTIVEISEEIAEIFRESILPHFPNRDKIKLICADAVEYMSSVKDGDYDFVFADIWEGIVDGAPLYSAIKKHESRLPDTEFTYWIKDQIEYYLNNE